MQFTPENAQLIMEGRKTQTRRPVKPHQIAHHDLSDYGVEKHRPILSVCARDSRGNWRLQWVVGKTYANQPGRGKQAIGRIKLLAIRKEPLQDIDEQDAIAEGFDSVEAFRECWDTIYKKAPWWQWASEPDAWVLTFERAGTYD